MINRPSDEPLLTSFPDKDDNGDENHEGDELNDGTSERKGCADGCDCGEHEGHEGNNADEEDDDEEDDDEEDNDEEDNDEYVATPRSLQFCKLVGILSCRAVALTICRNGKGQFFAKQENLEYWDFGEMVEKYAEQNPVLPWDHLQRSRVARLDMDRYPTRVINTETLEFETDPTLFKNKYCILSHMWQKDEVTYDTVKKVWAKYKEQQLETKIADLTRKVIEQRSKLDQAREDGVLGPKQLKEIEDKISHSEGEKRLLKRELESLIKAREKEEAAKKTGKDGIRRQPSTRRPAGVNPQPTGDLVGLGIKRSLTKRGTALGEGKSSGTTAGERKLMNAIRTARKLEFTYLSVLLNLYSIRFRTNFTLDGVIKFALTSKIQARSPKTSAVWVITMRTPKPAW